MVLSPGEGLPIPEVKSCAGPTRLMSAQGVCGEHDTVCVEQMQVTQTCALYALQLQ